MILCLFSMMYAALVAVLVARLIYTSCCAREGYTTPQYMHHKSKCFSCEAQAIAMYGEDEAWRANPAKSFDAEREAVAVTGDPASGFLAKTIKYY